MFRSTEDQGLLEMLVGVRERNLNLQSEPFLEGTNFEISSQCNRSSRSISHFPNKQYLSTT